MLKRLILAAAIAAGLASPALAQTMGQATTLFDLRGQPFGTVTNPIYVSGGGGGGGGGATGSVTPAGTNGGSAQAIQGIQGGVPVNGFTGQYNSTLPTFASGTAGYLTVDSNGRLILSPSSFPATQAISAASLPLPTGAATAANQNVTAAGTSATNAQAVQGVTGGIPQNVANGGTFAVQNTAPLPAGTNLLGKVGIDQTTPGTTNGVQITNQATQTTTGALQPPTAGTGKIVRTSTALAASASTTIAAANASRIAMGIQCGSGAVSVDETGAALTAAGVGNGTLFMPSGTAPYFTPPIASQTAVTAYTATAQTCVVTEYNR